VRRNVQWIKKRTQNEDISENDNEIVNNETEIENSENDNEIVNNETVCANITINNYY